MDQEVGVKDAMAPVNGIELHVRQWEGPGVPFVLVHGLSSNALTWEAVAQRLGAAGHAVLTVDQRGHGRSDKPDEGYEFAQVAADLREAIVWAGYERPVVAGQSWGGNVALEFGARYPGVARGLVFVDGGFIDLAGAPGATWERVAVDLRPPSLTGLKRDALARRMREAHPSWSAEGIEATLANLETLPDGTVRPWLSLDHHLSILRAMWEQRPAELYPLLREPVLITPAGARMGSEWAERRGAAIAAASQGIARSKVVPFEGSDHDIHVQFPKELAEAMLEALTEGFFD